jgi:hypothetical protein
MPNHAQQQRFYDESWCGSGYGFWPSQPITGADAKWQDRGGGMILTQSKYIYRVITSVPTFFVRMLGKLLDACIWLDDDLTTHFNCSELTEHVQLINFCLVAWKKWVHERKLPQCLWRSVTALYLSTLLCDIDQDIITTCFYDWWYGAMNCNIKCI